MKMNGEVCYCCAVKVEDPKHLAIDEEGNPVCLCTPCFNLLEKFFVKRRRNKNGNENA